MITIILVIYCFVVVALVGVVLLQRSEGGALGIGGGGPGGGFMSGRGAATALTRTTSVLAAIFMGTCLLLAVIAKPEAPNNGIGDLLGEEGGAGSVDIQAGEATSDDLLQGFGSSTEDTAAEDDAPASGDEAAPEAGATDAAAEQPAAAEPAGDESASDAPADGTGDEPQQ